MGEKLIMYQIRRIKYLLDTQKKKKKSKNLTLSLSLHKYA